MIAEQYPGLLERSDDEKLQLAAELWRHVMGSYQNLRDPELVRVLESRMEEYRDHPERVSSWEEVKARLLASRS